MPGRGVVELGRVAQAVLVVLAAALSTAACEPRRPSRWRAERRRAVESVQIVEWDRRAAE